MISLDLTVRFDCAYNTLRQRCPEGATEAAFPYSTRAVRFSYIWHVRHMPAIYAVGSISPFKPPAERKEAFDEYHFTLRLGSGPRGEKPA